MTSDANSVCRHPDRQNTDIARKEARHAFLLARTEQRLNGGRLAAACRLAVLAVREFEGSFDAHLLLGRCRRSLRDFIGAQQSFDQAIALAPTNPAGWTERSKTSLRLGKLREALADSLQATNRDPDSASAWSTLGRTLGKLGQYQEARRAYARAVKLEPDGAFTKGRLLQQQILACDWEGMDGLIAGIEQDLAAGKLSARPFVWQAVAESASSLLQCSTLFAHPPQPQIARSCGPRTDKRIRIGYLSGELRNHSISFLRVGIFENHDKSRFEVTAFDNGWDDGGAVRARINKAMDRIVSIRDLSDDAAAATIAQAGIDILVDLNGYNGASRNGVMARRPAPVQMTFPGYPGTLGADYIDYMLGDAMVIPPQHRSHYREAIALMPYSYQANDRTKTISDRTFTRAELGLPEAGFVFCCFNNLYKIMPRMFDAWARILHAVPGSVLWLLHDNSFAESNLRKAAAARGIDPDRLVFAPRMPLADHLARHRAAGLFLDTLPCNAHTTASDALWAGLPVLTLPGNTFSGRVAASLLHAVDTPGLVATTLQDYEALAIKLATDPDLLDSVRHRLEGNRLSTPLFDTALYTRHLEVAYETMHARRVSGLPPVTFAVPADPFGEPIMYFDRDNVASPQ